MGINIRRKSIKREDDNQLSLHVEFFETTNDEVLGTADVQGANAAELKAKLRPIIVEHREEYTESKSLDTAADAGIEELKTELGLPTSP